MRPADDAAARIISYLKRWPGVAHLIVATDDLAAVLDDREELAADLDRLKAELDEYHGLVECGGDSKCGHPTTLVNNENTIGCVWCYIETIRPELDRLKARIAAMANEAERIGREETEWWNPSGVAEDLRKALGGSDE